MSSRSTTACIGPATTATAANQNPAPSTALNWTMGSSRKSLTLSVTPLRTSKPLPAPAVPLSCCGATPSSNRLLRAKPLAWWPPIFTKPQRGSSHWTPQARCGRKPPSNLANPPKLSMRTKDKKYRPATMPLTTVSFKTHRLRHEFSNFVNALNEPSRTTPTNPPKALAPRADKQCEYAGGSESSASHLGTATKGSSPDAPKGSRTPDAQFA